MADFATHLGWGAVGAGLAASATYAANIVPEAQLMTLTAAGVIGSMLPDIDLEKAVPSRMLFTWLALTLAFVALFNFRSSFSIIELWLIWLGVFAAIRFGAYHIFHRTATHRGVFHSLLAGILFMVLTAVILSHGMTVHDPVVAWMAGLFVLLGFLIHLILDEVYAVDFTGGRLKKSFGTAMKLFEYKSLRASAAMAVALALLVPLAPPAKQFVEIMRPKQVTQFFRERMLPQSGWFKVRGAMHGAPVEQTASTPGVASRTE